MKKINIKIKYLDDYLKKNYNVSLARAIGQSDKSMKKSMKVELFLFG